MHRAGFLHGDIKPDNIHVVDAGQAVLLDLGFAPDIALAFYRAILPTVAGPLVERKLLLELRESFTRTHTGPLKSFTSLTSYLEKEQRLGRVSGRPSAGHLAKLLLGACFAQAYLEHILGEEARSGDDRHFARETVRSLMEGMTPKRTLAPAESAAKPNGKTKAKAAVTA